MSIASARWITTATTCSATSCPTATAPARHGFARYHKELFRRAVARGRPVLAHKVGAWVLARGPNRAIRKGMAELAQRPGLPR